MASMISPFTLPPHPLAQAAAAEVTARVHEYMRLHPQSELHRQGKMFGVLVYPKDDGDTDNGYIAAFSAQLDGSYHHEGFVPPVWGKDEGLQVTGYGLQGMPVGHTRAESQRLQRLLFAQYRFTNGRGEWKDLPELFREEKPIVPAEEWFGERLRVTGDGLRVKELLPRRS